MRTVLLFLVAVMLALVAAAKFRPQRSPGPFDITDLAGYMRRLARANTSEAARIRTTIDAGHMALDRERAAARQDGIPVTPEELNGTPIPASENAAQVYARLRIVLDRNPVVRESALISPASSPAKRLPASTIEDARRTLSAHKDAMALIYQATDRPRCQFRRNWSLGLDASFADMARLRLASKLLQTQSYLLARSGRCVDAVHIAARGLTLANHAASDSTMLGYLAGAAIEKEALASLQDVLFLTDGREGTADEVARALMAHRPNLSLSRALKGETVTRIGTAFESLRGLDPRRLTESLMSIGMGGDGPGTPAPDGERLPLNVKPFTPQERAFVGRLVDAAEADILRDMRRLIDASDKPWSERITIFRLSETDQTQDGSPIAPFRQAYFPLFRPACARDLVVKARADSLLAAADVLAYRDRTGALPDRLDEAMAQVPGDPFSDGPIQYRREANGFEVFSVGAQGTTNAKDASRESTLCRYVAYGQAAKTRLAALVPASGR